MEIHLARDGRKFGPYSIEEVRAKFEAGELERGDLAWYEGAPAWVPLTMLPHLNSGITSGAIPPLPPPSLPLYGQPQTSGLAIASLACGVSSLTVLPVLPALPAIICGHLALGQIRKSAGTLAGRGMALAGLIIGYCTLALMVLMIFALLAFGAAVLPAIQKGFSEAEGRSTLQPDPATQAEEAAHEGHGRGASEPASPQPPKAPAADTTRL